MRSALHVTVLVSLVVVSGCAGLMSFGHEYPPGVSETGVENATALADSHAAHLQSGYQVEDVTTYRATNGTVVQRITSETRWSQTEQRLEIAFENPHRVLGVRAEIYSNASGSWFRIQDATGTTTVQRAAPSASRPFIPPPGGAWSVVYAMATAPETTTTPLENGTTRIQYEDGTYKQGNASGVLHVTPDGLVTSYELAYDGRWRSHTTRIHTTRVYSDTGNANVTAPRWLTNTTAE